jgi:phage terminase Nu1 subunit (DNA packaging protein)
MKTTETEPLMDRDSLAVLFGVNPGTIHRWATLDGLPVAQGGGAGKQAKYLPSACVAWRLAVIEAKAGPAGALNPSAERARRDHHQALLAEQLHKKRAGTMLEVEDIRRVWGSIVLAVKSRLLRMPTSLAAACAVASSPAEIERLLAAEVRAALSELAAWTPPADPKPASPSTPRRKRSAR